jgi:hypothetical protein
MNDIEADLLIANAKIKKLEQKLAEREGRWNNHEVAELLANIVGDDCACNISGNDEWLPEVCDFRGTSCPDVVGVACWEQYLKHLGEKDAWLNKFKKGVNTMTLFEKMVPESRELIQDDDIISVHVSKNSSDVWVTEVLLTNDRFLKILEQAFEG